MNDVLVTTTYLPPIAFFASVLKAKTIIVEQHENYIKQTYRNRCYILTANGILPLSIPVNKVDGNHTLIKDIRISYINNWQTNHWRAIESAYNKSPFFLYYRDDLEKFYTQSYELLIDYNTELLRFILKKLGISTVINFTDDFLPIDQSENDERYSIHPKLSKGNIIYPHYYQVFEEKHGFIPNVSIIDLLFNEGPESKYYLENLKTKSSEVD
jgi:hypothetical protein